MGECVTRVRLVTDSTLGHGTELSLPETGWRASPGCPSNPSARPLPIPSVSASPTGPGVRPLSWTALVDMSRRSRLVGCVSRLSALGWNSGGGAGGGGGGVGGGVAGREGVERGGVGCGGGGRRSCWCVGGIGGGVEWGGWCGGGEDGLTRWRGDWCGGLRGDERRGGRGGECVGAKASC